MTASARHIAMLIRTMKNFLVNASTRLPPRAFDWYVVLLSRTLPGEELCNEAMQRRYWDDRSSYWRRGDAPEHPSPEDLEWYDRFIGGVENRSRALLLGATPRLRELLARQREHGETFVADFSARMLRATTHELAPAVCAAETRIIANWMEISPALRFDLILGDVVLQQFSPELESSFLEKISRHLNPGGACIMRCRFLNEIIKGQPIHDTVTEMLRNGSSEEYSPEKVESRAVGLFLRMCDVATHMDTR